MKKINTLLTFTLIMLCNVAFSQYFYYPRLDIGMNPGGLNDGLDSQTAQINSENPFAPGTGWTNILNTGTHAWTPVQSIPFPFDFNGNPVSEYIVAPSGVLTFSTSTTAIPDSTNEALPSTKIPDSSICIWGITNTGANDVIQTKTFGRVPNRQHWINFASFSSPQSPATGNWTYWSIVLEESSNNIYLVDMRTQVTPLSLTLGIQIDKDTAYQVSESPNVTNRAGNTTTAPSDNTYYEFIQGSLPDIDFQAVEITTPQFPNISDETIPVRGSISNQGNETVTSLNLNYTINGGNVVTQAVSNISIATGEVYEFLHGTPFSPTSSGDYSLEFWASNFNGKPDEENSNDTLNMIITVSDSIVNIIDDIIGAFKDSLIGGRADGLDDPTDLDFHPDFKRMELWAINRRVRSVGGSTTTYSNAGRRGSQTSESKVDGNSWHFMALPSGIAFSNNGNFGNSASIFNANSQDGNSGQAFTGPALWSSDPAIYAQNAGPGTNGSHYDMLHESPYTMGIAHEVDNAFWVYDGNSGDIVRYDFVADHGPGNDDHSDGRLSRYPVPISRITTGQDQTVPNHLVLDKKTDWLYIVDSKAGEVHRLDITSGTSNGPGSGNQVFQQTEPLAEYINMSNITSEVIIDTGLVKPSGIELIGERLLVSDYDNGDIRVYDIANDFSYLGKFATGNDGITGIKVGPEGNIWYTNMRNNELRKIMPIPTSINEIANNPNFKIYPNPSTGLINIDLGSEDYLGLTVSVTNPLGQTILEESISSRKVNIDLSAVENGIYFISFANENERFSKRIVINK